MSQRDLVAELRAARVEAPSEVRERVRLVAAGAPAPRRLPRLTWRRALVVAVPLAAALAATLVVTRPSQQHPNAVDRSLGAQTALPSQSAAAPPATAPGATAGKALVVPPERTRVQTYDATLSLRVGHARDVSDGVKRALRITTSLGGYSASVHAETHGARSVADLSLRIPRPHVAEALTRLAQLGTITDEHVTTVDRQASLNANDREIARLQTQLAVLRAQPSSADNDRRIAALVARIQRLQRSNAETRRTAHYATVDLHLENVVATVAKPHGHGPLHGVVVALEWAGIGAVYAAALGLPAAAVVALAWLGVRTLRRRREDALLSR